MLSYVQRGARTVTLMNVHQQVRVKSTQSGTKPTLPRLPVPDLHKTLVKYLKSLEPFLLEDESRGGPSFESAYNTRSRWADDFEAGLGKVCQERLQALDKQSPTNWLDDNFWLKLAYHSWRAPLLIHSNWWLAFHNDNSIPKSVIHSTDTGKKTGYTAWQLRRAAWLAHRTLEFRERLNSQELYPETTRTGIWFRTTALKMFNISRIPQEQCDAFSPLPPARSREARSIVVLAHDWFYAVEVLDESEQPLPVSEIERKLRAIVADVEKRLESKEVAVPVAILTTDHRDRWTENLRHLLSLSPSNQRYFQIINESLFALSLDHYTYSLPSDTSTSQSHSPHTSPEVTAHLHNIRSGDSARPARNRWYDKPLTLIVESNTRAGALGEHSPCDALVPSIVMEYAVVQDVDENAFEHSVESRHIANSGWERLDWVTDAKIAQECVDAEKRAKEIVDDSDDNVLWFDAYGSEWIKSFARLSPDAYIQVALQLAWYRTRGSFTATYETALTRLFRNGRTETIRSLSSDSRAFVLAMVDETTTAQTKFALLRRAIQTHSNLTRDAATGRGIDRHLLGLQQMLRGESHALFEDELFERSQTWELSTSGLSAGIQFRGTGFGAPYPDGYGINYLAGPELIKFGIESKHSSPKTSTSGFMTAISQALLDLQAICTQGLESHL